MTKTSTYLELCLRSLGGGEAFGRQEQIVDRLRSLERTETIDGYGVTVLGDSIRPHSNSSETEPGRTLRHKLFVWDHWCRRNGADRSQLFTVGGDGKESTVRVGPLVLVEYNGSRVKFISPYDDGDEHVSPIEHLDTLVTETPRRIVPRTDAILVEDPARSGWQNGPRRPDSEEAAVEEEHVP